MKINFDYNYHGRKSGGIFLGFRLHFPVSLCDDNDHTRSWRNISLQIGLILVTVYIHFNYAFKHSNSNRSS
jgi:hypothetical protein